MSDERIHDRYQVPPGNVEAEFVDEDKNVLVNKPGITDLETLQIAEEEFLAKAYEQLLAEVRMDTPMTGDLIRHVHQTIFGDLFEWAGRWRTVQISKPGAIWPPPQFLDQAMKDFERQLLAKYPAGKLTDEIEFCRAIGEIQGEFLAIHPFREGNALTIKLLTDLVSIQTGRPLLVYDASAAGQNNYIEAAKAALLKKDFHPMAGIIQQALNQAERTP
jgi:cell filamentation protein